MEYSITLVFMDGKTQDIEISEEKLPRFLDALGKDEVYYDEVKNFGVWLHIEKIRFFTIKKLLPNGE